MKSFFIFFFSFITVFAHAQLQRLNVPGDTQRQLNTKTKNNFNYLESRTDSIVANLSGGGPGGTTYNGDPSIIQQDATYRFVSDAQISLWNSKASGSHNHDALYAALNHDHDADYASITHNHDLIYAPIDHTHPGGGESYNGDPTVIDQDETHRFVTDVQITSWNNKANANHNHDASYALITHNHDDVYQPIGSYALANHNHTGVYQPVGSYALASHDHTGVYEPEGDYASATHNHDATYQPIGSYASATHNHDASYALITHNHDTDYADIDHLHTGIYQPVGSYSLTTHNHDGTYQPVGSYSLTTHNHDGTYQPVGSYSLTGHTHTKSEVGLANVDNTSDVNKPVSTAQATAINAKVEDNITDGATTTAPSENAVFDALAGKQSTLVSGTNIKTINGTSILGSGDIVVEGGGGASETKLILAADVTASTTTPVALTGMTFSYDANSTYRVNMYMIVTAVATTTGHGFGVDTSTAPTTIALGGTHVSNTSGGTASWQAIADNAIVHVSGGVPVAAALNAVQGQGVIVTGGTSGTATFIFRSEVAAATTCKAGSVITVLKVN